MNIDNMNYLDALAYGYSLIRMPGESDSQLSTRITLMLRMGDHKYQRFTGLCWLLYKFNIDRATCSKLLPFGIVSIA